MPKSNTDTMRLLEENINEYFHGEEGFLIRIPKYLYTYTIIKSLYLYLV